MNQVNRINYFDLGFDRFFSRIPPNSNNAMSSIQFEGFTDNLSGSKIQGGRMTTNDGQTELNLEQGYFKVQQGDIQLVRFGRLEDGTVGVLIKNQDGNNILEFNNEKAVMTSNDGQTSLDLNQGTFTVRDETGKIIVLLGKLEGIINA